MSLTPTQGFMTCDMIKRKTREKRGPHMTCGACGEHSQTPPKWSEVQEMPCLGMQQRTCKRCRGFTMLPHVRRCFAMSPTSQCWSQGLGSSTAEGAPRLTQGMEQAMDVQVADAQCDLQSPSERVAYRGGAYRLSRHGS